MKVLALAAAAALIAQADPAHRSGPDLAAAQPANMKAETNRAADKAAVRAILSRYKSAIERLDATGTEQLFTADSIVFETGGVEGPYGNYLAHHLGPELNEFKSFRFSDYKSDIRFEGPVAVAAETYKYRIETKAGEIAERLGVATSVLRKEGGRWKIVMMPNSARRPRAS